MNVKVMIIVGLLMFVVMCLIVFSYYKITTRFVSIFNKKQSKDYKRCGKILFLIISVILTALSVNVFEMLGITLLHFLVFTGLTQILNIIVRFLFVDKNLKVWEIINKSLIIPVICTIIVIVYGYVNIHDVKKTEYIIRTNEVSEEYKVILITDIHYGTVLDESEFDEVLDKINNENPDAIILGGDMVDESTSKEDIIKLYEKLANLNNTMGIYHVEGNHDRQKYSDKPTLSDEEYEKLKEELSIYFLEDDVIQINNDMLLCGRLDVSDKERLSIGQLLDKTDDSKFIIVADHQPREYEEAKEAGANLVVSGHTHAGQIFPVGYFTTLVGGAEQNYGLKMVDNMVGIVSSGLTGWGFPIRTSEHCEYVVIHIKPVV